MHLNPIPTYAAAASRAEAGSIFSPKLREELFDYGTQRTSLRHAEQLASLKKAWTGCAALHQHTEFG